MILLVGLVRWAKVYPNSRPAVADRALDGTRLSTFGTSSFTRARSKEPITISPSDYIVRPVPGDLTSAVIPKNDPASRVDHVHGKRQQLCKLLKKSALAGIDTFPASYFGREGRRL